VSDERQTRSAARGLAVESLSVSLGGHPVLDDVTLHVGPTEAVALLGPSGVGKSTLLRIVAGLVAPGVGRVLWDGVDLADVPAHRRCIGLVFQDAVLFPHRDVAGNVGYGLDVVGVTGDERRREIDRMLELVDLAGTGERAVDSLSGGQAQRVALARALAARPRLLLLDEPFGALDRELRDRLGADVRDLLRAVGVPAVHVTHDAAEAALVADRVLTLAPGPTGARLGRDDRVAGRGPAPA
jgi:thiamine transport system ATP-binding protein